MKTSFRALLLLFCLLGCSVAAAQSRPPMITLNGAWEFAVDREGKWNVNDLNSVRNWREIYVPLSWNAQFADLRDYRGVAWYRKQIDVQPYKLDETVLLHFGAVDYLAEVFLNGKKVGQHEGGYLPFTFDVGDMLKEGRNEIAVRVTDPDNDNARWGNMNYNELPHGKQSWYVQTGGIWQSVSLEVRPLKHIQSVHVDASTDGSIVVKVLIRESSRRASEFDQAAINFKDTVPTPKAIIRDTKGKVVSLQTIKTDYRWTCKGKVFQPQLWAISHPNLYTLEVSLPNGDRFVNRFGFRKFEARDGKFYLNGEPVYIISALDQDFYPEGIYSPPSYDFLVDQMRKAKQLGLNLLRTHIKVPTPEYLRAADEAGLLIWYEIPSWDDNTWTASAAKRGEDIFLGEIERDWNHPSVVIQSIVNEAWGVRGLKEEQTRQWLKDAFARLAPQAAKAGRLTVDNSPCCGNFHLKSDIADYHNYNSIPDNRAVWDKWVADLASRPSWLWSNHGDAEPTGKEPIVLSEFGNWGLPVLPETLPWWFERDFGGREVTRPAGVFDRFHGFKFDRLFAGFNDLARATQRHQWISLKHEIEEIRRYAPIQGYTITEFTDLNWECNGLLDMYRNMKEYAVDLARLQQQDVVFARSDEYSYTSTEKIELTTYVSRYSAAAAKQLKLTVYVDGKPHLSSTIKPASRGSVVTDESLALTAPNVSRPTAWRVKLDLRDGAKVIAENYVEFFIFPEEKAPTARGKVHLAGGLAKMAEWMTPAGYSVATSPDKQTVILTDKLDDAARSWLSRGHRVIVLADDKEALPAGAIKITPRNGATGYDGNWITNFNWVNVNRAPFSAVAFDKLLGFEAEAVSPKFVIEGVKPEAYDDVTAGIFLGWVNKNAALMLGAKMGEGRALLTTFRLAANYGSDEYARHLLDAMIKLAASDAFEPKLTL